jgi:heme/copper-type cytochrome/quinol oxidase subunit 3
MFVGLQVASYARVSAAGLHLSDGAYAAVFYGLTGLHALHVAVGLPALVWLAARARAVAAEPAARSTRLRRQLRGWALYMHFLAVVFGVMLLLVYR